MSKDALLFATAHVNSVVDKWYRVLNVSSELVVVF